MYDSKILLTELVPFSCPQDCLQCAEDFNEAVTECQNQEETSTLECIEYVLNTFSDCLLCLCELIGTIGGVDIDGCDPTYTPPPTLFPPLPTLFPPAVKVKEE